MNINPLPNPSERPDSPNVAADLIRRKLATIYSTEPDAKEELAEAEMIKRGRTKHQQFMHSLHNSGKSLAEIQTAWHNYYVELPNDEKHQVWQEFYTQHSKVTQYAQQLGQTLTKTPVITGPQPIPRQQTHSKYVGSALSASELKRQLLGKIGQRSKARPGSHLHSLAFGLSMGLIAGFLFLFSFFNERFVTPFITPSKNVSATPIIIDPTNTQVGPEAKIIIPKINVEIPVVYDEPSVEEKAVQKALENGVLHYATTPNPGEQGNGVIFGHSSNNILNKGKYKFAFVMLKHLEVGDLFMIQKDGKRYVYKVYDKKVVKPTEVSVLGNTGKPATFSLITCDPPGTSLNRLVVVGEQITPDPTANQASTAQLDAEQQPQVLAGNAPSLWQRIKNLF